MATQKTTDLPGSIYRTHFTSRAKAIFISLTTRDLQPFNGLQQTLAQGIKRLNAIQNGYSGKEFTVMHKCK